ncbi:MAG: hypothetical protein WCW77_04405 [Patescibacteria group bacterium]|jgi:hypothetical protein
MRKSILALTLFFAFFLVLPIKASAYELKKGDAVTIPKDQIINDNLYVAGSSITIEGRIRGDVFCVGQNINIKGPVEGSVFCAGQSINLDGPVSGSVRVAGNTVNINSIVGQNVDVFGAAVNLGSNAKVGWDMLIGAAGANIDGQIGKDLHGGGANVIINGKVGKNVNLALGEKNSSLTLGDNAEIKGNLTYKAQKDASISSKAKVAGKTERKEYNKGDWQGRAVGRIVVWGLLFSIFSAILIGLVLIGLFKKPVITISGVMQEKISSSIGIGFLTIILGPIALILLALTVVGIPLALILLALWLISLAVSKVMAGIFIGRILIQKYWPAKKDSLTWQMIIGILIFTLIAIIPFIGWLLAFIAVCWAFGGMLIAYRKSRA